VAARDWRIRFLSAGPAIVEQMDATTLIVPGATATVDPYLNLLLELP